MAKPCQNLLVWWKITPCSILTFLPYLVLLCSLVVLKCISSVYCFLPLSNNQMHFLYTSPALMHSACILLSVPVSVVSPLTSQGLLTILCLAAGRTGCFWQHFWAVSLCYTPLPRVSNLQHLYLPFLTRLASCASPSWNDSYGGKGWGHLFPSAVKPVAASVSLWRLER